MPAMKGGKVVGGGSLRMQFPVLTLKLALKYLKGLEQVVEISNRWAEKAKEGKARESGGNLFSPVYKKETHGQMPRNRNLI